MFTGTLENIASVLKKATGAAVMVGVDPTDPLPIADAPFIILSPGTSGISFADTDEADEISVDIDFGITDETTVETEDGVRIKTGLRNLDLMAKKIKDALKDAVPDYYLEQGTYYSDLSQYPAFLGGMTIIYKNDGFIN